MISDHNFDDDDDDFRNVQKICYDFDDFSNDFCDTNIVKF